MTNRSNQPGTGMLLIDSAEHLIVENQFGKYVDTLIRDGESALNSQRSLFNTYSF